MRPFLALLLAASPAAADPQLAGTYQGIIWSAGYDDPGTTVLSVDASGAISGRYAYMDGASQAEGILTACRFDAPILRCQWNDVYGSGAWVVRVNRDRTAFEGSWYDYSLPEPHDQPEGGYRWTGRKSGS
jgi:hypothetical protein